MAAVDATLAECIEDAFAAGYTDDTLAKLLQEATLYIPPGTAIQAAVADRCSYSDARPCLSDLITAAAVHGFAGPMTKVAPVQTSEAPMLTMVEGPCRQPATKGPSAGPSREAFEVGTHKSCSAQISTASLMIAQPFCAIDTSCSVEPPGCDTRVSGAADEDIAFKEFMDAFRSEMRQTQDKKDRAGRFVLSRVLVPPQRSHSQARSDVRADPNSCVCDEVGIGQVAPPLILESASDDDDYEYWPDELVTIGIGLDEPQISTTTPRSMSATESTSTTETENSEECTDTDAWPIEML
jgi:hypothetical protein